MRTLVGRLRWVVDNCDSTWDMDLLSDAADEIERLEAQAQKCAAVCDLCGQDRRLMLVRAVNKKYYLACEICLSESNLFLSC